MIGCIPMRIDRLVANMLFDAFGSAACRCQPVGNEWSCSIRSDSTRLQSPPLTFAAQWKRLGGARKMTPASPSLIR